MDRTQDTTPRILVMVVKSAYKNEVCQVVMFDVAKPVMFGVIVHRDVVVGEVLELVR